jgi:hypothetical protein
MPTFTLTHEINCTPERFWQLFFDNDFQKKIFATLQFPKWDVVDFKETDKEIVRVIQGVPKIDAPAAVTKVLGSGFGYTEEGRFDKSTKVFRFVIKPTALAEKLRNEGTVRCEPKGDGKCIRTVELTTEAKIFGIGGMMEKTMEKSARDGWQKGADLLNEHLRGG